MDEAAHARALEIWNSNPDQQKIPIWLDCDPGHDDAFSILFAAHCPRFDLLGVSTVHGNAALENTTWNAQSVLEAVGKHDVPVYPGAEKPFSRWPCYAPEYHGKTGLDGTDLLPDPKIPPVKDVPAIKAMYDALSKQPKGTAWLITNGALTNAALLLTIYPDIVDHLAGLSIMGGGIGNFFTHAPMGRFVDRVRLSPRVWQEYPKGPATDMPAEELAQIFREKELVFDAGKLTDKELAVRLDRQRKACGNWTSSAEFNIYCDPEAAQAIFSNEKLAAITTLIPLDVTHQVLADPKVLHLLSYGYDKVKADSVQEGDRSKIRQMFHELLIFFSKTYHDQFGMNEGPPLHDPVTVAVALAPALLNDQGGERFDVYVDCEGEKNSFERKRAFKDSKECGRTVARMVDQGAKGVRIPRTLDIDAFWMLIDLAMSSAEKVSPLSDPTGIKI